MKIAVSFLFVATALPLVASGTALAQAPVPTAATPKVAEAPRIPKPQNNEGETAAAKTETPHAIATPSLRASAPAVIRTGVMTRPMHVEALPAAVHTESSPGPKQNAATVAAGRPTIVRVATPAPAGGATAIEVMKNHGFALSNLESAERAADDYAAGRLDNRAEVITDPADRAMLNHRRAAVQLGDVANGLDEIANHSTAPATVNALRGAATMARQASAANKKADDEWNFWGKARAYPQMGQQATRTAVKLTRQSELQTKAALEMAGH